MILKHYLKKGFNSIPLKDVSFSTLHQEIHDGTVRHIGFVVKSKYAGDNPRNSEHKYDIIFETETEFRELLVWAEKMKDRFPDGELPAIAGEELVEDPDEE